MISSLLKWKSRQWERVFAFNSGVCMFPFKNQEGEKPPGKKCQVNAIVGRSWNSCHFVAFRRSAAYKKMCLLYTHWHWKGKLLKWTNEANIEHLGTWSLGDSSRDHSTMKQILHILHALTHVHLNQVRVIFSPKVFKVVPRKVQSSSRKSKGR